MSDNFKIWFNGKMRPYEDCTVHVASHALHYGSSVFEGVRAYDTPGGTALFRLTDHLERLLYSASVYRIPMPWSVQELHAACCEAVRVNGLKSAYVRPLVMPGKCGLGVIPKDINKVDVAVIVTEWGAYLGDEGLQNGVTACVTSWARLAPNTMPAGVKAGGNYLSSQLIGFEARDRGCDEGIALGYDGLLSEGTGENIFVIAKGRILTPPASSSILSGITRDTVIALANDAGYEIIEQAISRDQLYAADEVFFTGTAVEVTPVRKIDHIVIGDGLPGPLTRKFQSAFFGLFDGRTKDTHGWLEYV
jgi:branched-chain amino acid aminotransferase